MKSYDYFIVGGGMAAASAIKGIREVDREGSIGVACAESDPPYDRPPLSKSLWKGKPLEKIWMETDGAEILLDSPIAELRPADHTALLGGGEALEYGRLLIATGANPSRLPFPADAIDYVRDLRDYRALRERCESAKRFLVVGGGFIATEIAAALALNGKKIAMVFPEEGLVSRLLPREFSLSLNEFYREKGIELHPGESLSSLGPAVGGSGSGRARVARTVSGSEIEADAVVAGIGARPNSELASRAGLIVDDGISVGPDLKSSDPDIFAAGDVASYYCAALGRRVRVEHEDNALAMGLVAGRSMAGAAESYDQVPYFYSDLFELGYEAVGSPDPRCETFVDWKSPGEKAVIYYLAEGRVRGVLLWRVEKRAEAARALVAEPGPFAPKDLAGRL